MYSDDEIIASLQPDEDRPEALPEYEPAPVDTGAAPSGSVPPPAIPAFDQPEYGPPAPDPTDAIALPPVQAGIPTRDPEKDMVPAVPREAPGNIGAPAPLPGAPGAAPAGSPGGAGGEPAPGTTGNVIEAMERERKAGEDRAEAERRALEGNLGTADAKLDAAVERKAAVDDHVLRAQQIQERYDKADAAANARLAQTQQALSGFKFHDYWANKSTGDRVLSALGVFFGTLGSGLTKTPNYALQVLNKAMDDDHRDQVGQLNQLKDDVLMARTGINDARAARTAALADLTAADGAKDKLVAAKLEERLATISDANARNVLAAQVAKLNQEAEAKNVEAAKLYRQLSLEDQEKAERLKLMQAQEENLRAHAAGTGGYQRKGKGSGGTVAGGAVSNAAEELARRIRLGNGGKPLTEDEMIHAANELHIPLEGKAGHVSLASIKKGVAFDANESRKAKNLPGARLVSKEVNDWAAKNGVSKILQTQRELDALQNSIKVAGNNPLQQALALESAVKAARGGAATQGMLNLALQHLGGTLDGADALINKLRTGQMGDKQWSNFKSFVNAQQGTAQREGKEAYDKFEMYMKDQSPEKRQQLMEERSRLFSGMHGFGGRGGGEGAAADPRIAKARAAVAPGSGATDVQRRNAQAFLDAHGG